MAWRANLESAWPRLAGDFRDAASALRFRRFWRYDLLCCAAFFHSRQGQLWQLVLSKANLPNASIPYRTIRAGGCPLAAAAPGRIMINRAERPALN